MHRMVRFTAACLSFIALIVLVIWIMGGFGDMQISVHGWIAYGLGITLTSALGVALMALVFHSNRSGQDENAGRGDREQDR